MEKYMTTRLSKQHSAECTPPQCHIKIARALLLASSRYFDL